MKSNNMIENRYWYYGGTNSNPKTIALSTQVGEITYSNFLTEVVPDEYFTFVFNVSRFNGKSNSTGNGFEILFSNKPKEANKTMGWGFNSYKSNEISYYYTRSYNKQPKAEDIKKMPFDFMFNKKYAFTLFYTEVGSDKTNPGYIELYVNNFKMPIAFNVHKLQKFGIYVGVGGLSACITCC